MISLRVRVQEKKCEVYIKRQQQPKGGFVGQKNGITEKIIIFIFTSWGEWLVVLCGLTEMFVIRINR